ncbi:unnamed protein product [Sphenostylis stenocarpa]|uniref:Superoxide dismutase n=1 Tax=Sphenostylis stenocarpa TaxID=92480 RepID=A0AA86SUJ8_9FABA|nr:unnamed protein product [Sphenostylis stenocarpa]
MNSPQSVSSPSSNIPLSLSFFCMILHPALQSPPSSFPFGYAPLLSLLVPSQLLLHDALEPHMSKKTIDMHWGEYHRNFIEGLNKQLEKDDILYGYTLDELVKVTYNNGNPFPQFHNAAEVWNHDFFWESMQPGGGDMPKLGLLQQIEKDFGSFTNFRKKFVLAALTLFGSGWVWLVLKREEKKLEIIQTSNAICPIVWDDIPLINLDLWEHAYYLDYRNDTAKYVDVFMNHLISWEAAAVRLTRGEAFVNLGEPKIPIA